MPDYPCRCLWRGSVQITLTTPLRRMILQLRQIFLTEASTFIANSYGPYLALNVILALDKS